MRFVDRSINILGLMLIIAALSPVITAQEKAVHGLEILKPTPGETLRGLSDLEIEVTGAADEPIILVLTWGDVVHYHLVDPEDPKVQEGRIRIQDPYFPAIEGSHSLRAELKKLDGEKSLLLEEVAFSMARPEEDGEIQAICNRLYLQAENVDIQRNGLEVNTLNAKISGRDPRTDEWVMKSADHVLWGTALELKERIKCYCLLSRSLEKRFELEKSLQALEYAAKIYETEEKSAHTHPLKGKTSGLYGWGKKLLMAPAHFNAFAEFSARRGNPDTAGAWLMKEALFYELMAKDPTLLEKDRKPPWSWAAQAYRKIAFITFLLTGDLDRYKEWMERAKEVEKKGDKPPS